MGRRTASCGWRTVCSARADAFRALVADGGIAHALRADVAVTPRALDVCRPVRMPVARRSSVIGHRLSFRAAMALTSVVISPISARLFGAFGSSARDARHDRQQHAADRRGRTRCRRRWCCRSRRCPSCPRWSSRRAGRPACSTSRWRASTPRAAGAAAGASTSPVSRAR